MITDWHGEPTLAGRMDDPANIWIPTPEEEIREICRAVLSNVATPDLYWHVNVMRGYQHQPGFVCVYVDYDILRIPANVDVGRFHVNLKTWQRYSPTEKKVYLNNEIGKMLADMHAATQVRFAKKTIWVIDESKLKGAA